ncbi:proteinase-activated receptor 3 [Anguilla anguilla]|uniref:proteinase-activated receptor 3 n=1 Tax=Anguilla anguilla TaxID=7936 RepID=UPI0015A87BBE|nr:proteinase-activated receptor 3 [Anguilla anguilla]
MRKLLLLVPISLLLLGLPLPGKGKKPSIAKRNASGILIPKTFNGRSISTNSNELDLTSLLPEPKEITDHVAEYFHGVLSTRIIPAAYILAMIIGIPANAFILGTFAAKTKTFSTAILYCSLAVSDLLFLVTLAFKVHYHLAGNDWVFGEAACRVVTACFYGNAYCSIHTLACIAVKRYVAIVHPFTYKSLPKHQCTVCTCLAVWAVFAVAMVPELLIRQTYRIPQVNVTTCHDVLPLEDPSLSFLLYYKLALTFLGFVPAFLVTLFTYGSILRQLGKSDSDWASYMKASTLVFVIFAVCFAPSSVIHFAHYVNLYTSSRDHFYAYYNAAVCLCGLHSCLDPFLFCLMSKATRSKRTFMTYRGKNISLST